MTTFQNLSDTDKCSVHGCDRCPDPAQCPSLSKEARKAIETHRQIVAMDQMNNVLFEDSNDWREDQYSEEDWGD